MKKDCNGIYIDENMQLEDSVFADQVQDDLFDIEDQSWWFRLRAKLIQSVAEHFLKRERLTMDIGGGNGYTTKVLQNAGFKTGVLEPSYEACLNAKRRDVKYVLCSSVGERKEAWAQCMLLDVLEHTEDDVAFLKMVNRELKPGGRMILTVPAMQMLWSSEDDEAGHYRRYSKKMLCEVLKKAGFKVCYCSYFFSWLVLPVLIIRVGFEKIGLLKTTQERTYEEKLEIGNQQFKQKSCIVNSVLSALNKLEIKAIQAKRSIPLGSSLICIAIKVF